MTKKFINPPGLKPLGMYTQATTARGGTMVFISGQVAVDDIGRTVGAGDIKAQAVQVFENLKAILASAGMSFTDTVKVTTYLIHEDLIEGFRKVRAEQMGDHRPAATLVIARRLAQPGWLVEVEAIAAKA